MASLTQWTWDWVDSGHWWWTNDQGGLARCSPWSRKESDTTERLNWTSRNHGHSTPGPQDNRKIWVFRAASGLQSRYTSFWKPMQSTTHTHTHTHKHPQNEERETSQRSLSYSLQLEVGSRELRMGELLPSIYDGIVDLSLWNRGENLEDILTSHVPLH